jgi:hypothetical protein
LTGDRFDVVDMEYCNFWADFGCQIPNEFCINIRRILLRLSEFDYDFGSELSNLPIDSHQSNLFIHGTARLCISSPTLIEARVSLYDSNVNNPSFLYDAAGQIVVLRRTMGKPEASTAKSYQYDIGGRLMWPHGDCDIAVHSQGAVSFEFSTDDCVSGEEFAKDYDKWIGKGVETL